MIELFPEGFEEVDGPDGLELAAYTTAAGEERLWQAFGGTSARDVEVCWEDRWRSFHHPVRIGPLWVGPPWEEPPHDAAAVLIDPGRAFGTGGHATTRLCLELLLELPRGSLLDVGCGSGVLAIAAAKLGFTPVVAVDVDRDALEATQENVRVNDVEVETRLADALLGELPPTDVAVANIALATVEQLAPRLRCNLLVASGYLAPDRPQLPAYRHVRRRAADGWRADLYERQTQ